MNRAAGRVLAAVAVGGALLGPAATGTPAAAEDRPTVSFDGEHWGSTVAAPLWSGGPRWVPGDRRTVSLWLRNDDTVPARFAIAVTVQNVDGDPDLAPPLAVTVHTEDVRLAVGARPVTLPEIAAGSRRELDLTLALPATAGNADQLGRAEVRVRISTTGSGATIRPLPGWPVYVAAGVLLIAAAALAVSQVRTRRGAS